MTPLSPSWKMERDRSLGRPDWYGPVRDAWRGRVEVVAIKPGTNRTSADSDKWAARAIRLLKFCRIPRTTRSIRARLRVRERHHLRKAYLEPLLQRGCLRSVVPAANSRLFRYITTAEGRAFYMGRNSGYTRRRR